MNKLISTSLAYTAFALISGCASNGMMKQDDMKAGTPMKGSGMEMKMMDANSDGMLSKEEFMKYHEAMFEKMKGDNGKVNIKDMQMMGDMMKK